MTAGETAAAHIREIAQLCKYDSIEDMPYSDFIKMVGRLDETVRTVNELRAIMPPVLSANAIAKVADSLFPDWRKRNRNFQRNVSPRHCVYYLIRKYTPLSLIEIGKYCKVPQDHTTVMNAIKAVKDGIATGNPNYIHTLEQLQREINKLLNLN